MPGPPSRLTVRQMDGAGTIGAGLGGYVPPRQVRVITVALIRHGMTGEIFVTEFVDPGSGERLHRPAGGGIDFGETSAQALRREFREEFGTDLDVGERLAVLENLFVFNGCPGHEWVVVHEARFTDPAMLGPGPFPVRDVPTDVGVWRPPSGADLPRLCPAAIAHLL